MSAGTAFGEPSQLARRRLRVAQQAFRSAQGLADFGASDADRVAAVVQFDFAVETILRAVLFEARHPKARAEAFRELLNETREILKTQGLAIDVPGRGGLEQVRGIRNAAQHDARVPTRAEVTECAVHARDALVDLARLAWGTDFFAADVDAVRSARAAEHLRRALETRSKEDLHGAMGWLRAAFEYAFSHGGEKLVGPNVSVKENMVRTQGSSSDRRDPFGRGLDAAIALERLQVLGRLRVFGMDVREYIHWRNKLADAPALNIGDGLIRYEGREHPWDNEDFDVALAYVVDSVLRMEQVVEDLDHLGFHRGGLDKL